jgi:hypothetical protein
VLATETLRIWEEHDVGSVGDSLLPLSMTVQ